MYEVGKYEAHLEFVPQDEQSLYTCSWIYEADFGYGPKDEIPCSNRVEVWFVYEDRWGAFDGEKFADDIRAIEFCRAHGNIVLIEERKEGVR